MARHRYQDRICRILGQYFLAVILGKRKPSPHPVLTGGEWASTHILMGVGGQKNPGETTDYYQLRAPQLKLVSQPLLTAGRCCRFFSTSFSRGRQRIRRISQPGLTLRQWIGLSIYRRGTSQTSVIRIHSNTTSLL